MLLGRFEVCFLNTKKYDKILNSKYIHTHVGPIVLLLFFRSCLFVCCLFALWYYSIKARRNNSINCFITTLWQSVEAKSVNKHGDQQRTYNHYVINQRRNKEKQERTDKTKLNTTNFDNDDVCSFTSYLPYLAPIDQVSFRNVRKSVVQCQSTQWNFFDVYVAVVNYKENLQLKDFNTCICVNIHKFDRKRLVCLFMYLFMLFWLW